MREAFNNMKYLNLKTYKIFTILLMSITIFNMSSFGVFFSLESDKEAVIREAGAATIWPDCGWKCKAKNLQLLSLKLGDINGDPLSCEYIN